MLGLQRKAANAAHGTELPSLRAVLSIAPNSQSLSPSSLRRIRIPTVFVAGTADVVVPPKRHAGLAAREIPHARIVLVPGAEHCSFLATCTPLGVTMVAACRHASQLTAAHATAIEAGSTLFDRTLRR